MNVKTIAIIGAGNVGRSLGRGWERAGYNIIYGVVDPNPEKYSELFNQSTNVKVDTVARANNQGDVTVLAVPWGSISDAISSCGKLDGKIIVDATNPVTLIDDSLTLSVGFTTSGAEELAKLAPQANVVKAMNQVGFAVMSETYGYPSRPTMFVAGDNENSKEVVEQLVNDLGFRAIDAGPLESARLLEPYAMLWIEQAITHNAPDTSAFAFMQKTEPESITEYIRYELESNSANDLIDAYSAAGEYLKSSPECLGYHLAQCAKSENHFILRIIWRSAEAHMIKFRGGENFPPFLEIVQPYISEIVEMRHYNTTRVDWFR